MNMQRLDQILKESDLFTQEQQDLNLEKEPCGISSHSGADDSCLFDAKVPLNPTEQEIEELIFEENFEPSFEQAPLDRGLALDGFKESALEKRVIITSPVEHSHRDHDVSQNVAILQDDSSQAIVRNKLLELSLKTPTTYLASMNLVEPSDGIVSSLQETLVETDPNVTDQSLVEDDKNASDSSILQDTSEYRESQVDLVTDIIFGELLEEINHCSTVMIAQLSSRSNEHVDFNLGNSAIATDEPVSNHAKPLSQEDVEDILKIWIVNFVPDSNDGFTQSPILEETLLLHTLQNVPEQSRRFEEICMLYDATDEMLQEIFLPFEVNRQSNREDGDCIPNLSLLPLSKQALLEQLSAKVLGSWDYVQVHDKNLDGCLIQNVKFEEKGWAHLSRAMQTDIVNRITDALFDELLQDSSRISVTLMALPISES
jgi:hypothetical protein